MRKFSLLFVLMFTFCCLSYARGAPVPYSSGDYDYKFYSGTYVSIYQAEIPNSDETSDSDNANTKPGDSVHGPPAFARSEIGVINYHTLSQNTNDQSETLTGFVMEQFISVSDSDQVGSSSNSFSQATGSQDGYVYPDVSGNLRLVINISGTGTDAHTSDNIHYNWVKCTYEYSIKDYGDGDKPAKTGTILWSGSGIVIDEKNITTDFSAQTEELLFPLEANHWYSVHVYARTKIEGYKGDSLNSTTIVTFDYNPVPIPSSLVLLISGIFAISVGRATKSSF